MATEEQNCGCEGEMTFEEICASQREKIKKDGEWVHRLLKHPRFEKEETYDSQHDEMKANIMLTYRHLEDARMRIGKILQAADDGVSILDKPNK
jgi:hypothetical protein